jgi:CHASE3 domain sensor protein
MNTKFLYSCNYVEYLKRRMMIGPLDPWRRTDDDEPLYALLVSLETAINECKDWSNQDIVRKEFMDYLKINNIWAFKNVDEFVEVKKERKAEKIVKKKITRNFTPEQRKELSERMKLLNSQKTRSIPENPQ